MFKKGLFFAFFIGLCFAVSAQEQDESAFIVSVNNDEVTVTGYTGNAKNLVIPESIDNYPVVSIGTLAFYGCQLISVTIPRSVTSIKTGAFRDNLLSTVTVYGSTSIEDYAFDENVRILRR